MSISPQLPTIAPCVESIVQALREGHSCLLLSFPGMDAECNTIAERARAELAQLGYRITERTSSASYSDIVVKSDDSLLAELDEVWYAVTQRKALCFATGHWGLLDELSCQERLKKAERIFKHIFAPRPCRERLGEWGQQDWKVLLGSLKPDEREVLIKVAQGSRLNADEKGVAEWMCLAGLLIQKDRQYRVFTDLPADYIKYPGRPKSRWAYGLVPLLDVLSRFNIGIYVSIIMVALLAWMSLSKFGGRTLFWICLLAIGMVVLPQLCQLLGLWPPFHRPQLPEVSFPPLNKLWEVVLRKLFAFVASILVPPQVKVCTWVVALALCCVSYRELSRYLEPWLHPTMLEVTLSDNAKVAIDFPKALASNDPADIRFRPSSTEAIRFRVDADFRYVYVDNYGKGCGEEERRLTPNGTACAITIVTTHRSGSVYPLRLPITMSVWLESDPSVSKVVPAPSDSLVYDKLPGTPLPAHMLRADTLRSIIWVYILVFLSEAALFLKFASFLYEKQVFQRLAVVFRKHLRRNEHFVKPVRLRYDYELTRLKRQTWREKVVPCIAELPE